MFYLRWLVVAFLPLLLTGCFLSPPSNEKDYTEVGFNIREHRYNSTTDHSRQRNETDWRSDFSYVATVDEITQGLPVAIFLETRSGPMQAPLRLENPDQTIEINVTGPGDQQNIDFETGEIVFSGYLSGTNSGEDHTIRDDIRLNFRVYVGLEDFPDDVKSEKVFQPDSE